MCIGNKGGTGFVSIEGDKGRRFQVFQVKRLILRHVGKLEGMFFSIDVFIFAVTRFSGSLYDLKNIRFSDRADNDFREHDAKMDNVVNGNQLQAMGGGY